MDSSRSPRSLQAYRRKRDFSKTDEPSGAGSIEKPTGHAFVVQKHAATHLHYDFRLEMNGVLKSWAVAKGPSVDPAVKRLAIEVEDHPLAYGRFEGTIPKGQYGGGTVMLWDRGTWHSDRNSDPEKDYKSGRLKFTLNGSKMKGQWALVRMKPRPQDRHPNWLLIKDRDAEAAPGRPDKLLELDKSVKSGREMADIAAGSAVWQSNPKSGRNTAKSAQRTASRKKAKHQRAVKMPEFIVPQLATRVDAAPPGENWLHEIKFDGYRIHVRVENGRVKILTRHGEDWTARFKELTQSLNELPADTAYIDGEVVILNTAGISDFGALQNWFKSPGKRGVTFYAFDVLFLNGKDLRRLPLMSRKEVLRDLISRQHSQNLRYSDHQLGSGPAFFAASAGLGVEGIISKAADAAYASGRTRSWLKIKQIARQEFVIVGYTLSTVNKQAIGALLLAEYEDKTLRYVGKVGTGFSNTSAKALFRMLSALSVARPPLPKQPAAEARRGAKWVQPKVVAEVKFGAWTSDRILRHATFLGLREDKEPEDVKAEVETPVREVIKARRARADSKTRKAAKPKKSAVVCGVTITHPERVIYPKEGITKHQVARYYESIADRILPHIAHRPLSLVRCPDGVGPACFFQKHAGAGLPESITEHRIGAGKNDAVLTISTAEGLVSLIQRGVLEIHVWGSHLDQVEQPDLIVFDFDPDEAVKWRIVAEAAMDMRDELDDLGLKSYVKTTGGKGLHVIVPVRPQLEWDAIKQFSRAVAERFAARDSAAFITNMSKKLRQGRIFIDYLRNGRGATAVAPYSTRARPGATVATPLSWQELKDGVMPGDFTVLTVPKRLGQGFKDPWRGMTASKQAITSDMIEMLSEDS